MDEGFLQAALAKMGENMVVSIKVMKNKFTGEPASYGFINFNSDHHALIAMHRLNDKVIPTSNPVRKVDLEIINLIGTFFKLNMYVLNTEKFP